MRVNLSKLPDAKSLSSVTLKNLYGGLNINDDPTEIASNQSPDMLNMWYRDGILRTRDGKKKVFESSGNKPNGQVWFYDKMFHGLVVYVDGTEIRYFDPTDTSTGRKTVSGTNIPANTPHGCFFAFDERLYYKAKGIYLRLSYTDGELTAENILWKSGSGYEISDSVYTPIIAINRNASGTGGDLYQPENRINPKKEVWFDIDDSSYNYYLPVHGCSVLKVRIGDEEVETTDKTRTYTCGGRDFTIYDEVLPRNSGKFTRLKFSGPLYVDDTGWTAKNWTGSVSGGWSYIPNIVYSNFAVKATQDTEYVDGKVLYPASSKSAPAAYGASLITRALRLCPHTNSGKYFIFYNGTYLSVFIPLSGFVVTNYDSSSTEIWMKNFYRVTYYIPDGTRTLHDYAGKTSEGWNYTKSLVYSNYQASYGGNVVIAKSSTAISETEVAFAAKSMTTWAREKAEADGTTAGKLLWISQSDEYVVYHYALANSNFYVTKYDAVNNWFKAKGIRCVTIRRSDPNDVTVEDLKTSGEYGFYVKNIIWASEDIVWNRYVPGNVLLKKSTTELPAEYKKYVDIALYRAKRDYPDANITGNYAVGKSGDYIGVWIDTGMEIKEYNVQTGEFKASNFITESIKVIDEPKKGDISLVAPANLSNKLRVTYSKDNPDAIRAIADCLYSTSFGGTDAVCAVMGCCDKQPNAIFWSGNGSYGVDATYFPMDQYNLCGAYQDPITGFGKQQSVLVVFQEHHIAKASYGLTEIGGRKYIDLTLATINAERGCDRPWSIALCGNNLVWMNSRLGVMYLKDTSSAYENMVVPISVNVNGTAKTPGLLKDIADSNAYRCVGVEDGKRYYAFAGTNLYVWDFSISSVGDGISSLSWTKHSTFGTQAAMEGDTGVIWMANGSGMVSKFDSELSTDFGSPISCHYTTPTQNFGGYVRLRTIQKVLFALRSAGALTIQYGGEGQNVTQVVDTKQPEANGFWLPVVLKPRGIHVHHFFASVSSDSPMEIDRVDIMFTTHNNTK